jgi:DNA polymerase-3 subunit epsilon
MKMVFFDTETTGLRPGSICQLSYIVVDTSIKPASTIGKNMFFTVDYVEPGAEDIHGFSVEKLYELSNGSYFEDSFESILEEFRSADFVIGHNVNFDIGFICHEFEGCGEEFVPSHVFCTMNYYRDVCKILDYKRSYKNPKLEEVVKFLGIDKDEIHETSKKYFGGTANFHDARFDTAATYMIVVEGIKKGFIPRNYFSNIANNA